MQQGGMAPAVLNAANEVAVEAFLAGRLGFLQIAQLVAETLEMAEGQGVLGSAHGLERRAGRRRGGAKVGAELAGDRRPCRPHNERQTGLLSLRMAAEARWRWDFSDQGLGRGLELSGGSAAVLVRPDGRRVHSRARPFPRRPLVRREGQGLLHRLRQGDLRLLRSTRHPLALRLDTARRLRQVSRRREQRQRALQGRAWSA